MDSRLSFGKFYLNVYLRLKFPYFGSVGHARDTKYICVRGGFDAPQLCGTSVRFPLYVMQSSTENWDDQKDVLKSALSCIVLYMTLYPQVWLHM